MKKAMRASLRFARLNEDAYARPTVYRDNEDLRAKVSRDSRGVYMHSRGTKPKNKTRRGAAFGEEATHGTCTICDSKLFRYPFIGDKFFFLSQIEPLEIHVL